MKTHTTSHAPAAPHGPIDWRALVGWLREDGVISADEAARTVARCHVTFTCLTYAGLCRILRLAVTPGSHALWRPAHPNPPRKR